MSPIWGGSPAPPFFFCVFCSWQNRPMNRRLWTNIIAVTLLVSGLTACDSVPADDAGLYTEGQATRGGTGRYYMGREIAGVMNYRGAGWLERAEREREERTDLTLERLPLEPDSIVADIGAGSGYFTRRIARRIPRGRVIAADIQPEMLDILARQAADEGIRNVDTLLTSPTSLGLQPDSIDVALMVDVYHELSHPREIAEEIGAALRPEGQLILIEYRAEDPSVPIIPVHKMSEKTGSQRTGSCGAGLRGKRRFPPEPAFPCIPARE